jgi:hypothetical protein
MVHHQVIKDESNLPLQNLLEAHTVESLRLWIATCVYSHPRNIILFTAALACTSPFVSLTSALSPVIGHHVLSIREYRSQLVASHRARNIFLHYVANVRLLSFVLTLFQVGLFIFCFVFFVFFLFFCFFFAVERSSIASELAYASVQKPSQRVAVRHNRELASGPQLVRCVQQRSSPLTRCSIEKFHQFWWVTKFCTAQ